MTALRFNRKACYLAGFIILILLAGGCSGERDEYSFPPMIYDEAAYLREIEAAGDLIALSETRANYAVALKKSPAVEEALDRKWEYLAEKTESEGGMIGRLSDTLELWAFDFTRIGMNQYRLHLLFRVTGKLDDNYGIGISGRLPDPELLKEPYREQGYRMWIIRPLPPTVFWEEGEFVVVRDDIEASGLPYELRIAMFSPEGRYGNNIPIGVMRKIEEMPVTGEDIVEADDPFQIYEWLSSCHARAGEKGELVRRRYREVIAGLPQAQPVEDGVELLAAKAERVTAERGRVRLLFRAEETIDREYYVSLYGLVAPEDTEYLSEARRKAGRNSELWFVPIYPPLAIWEAGEPVMVTLDLDLRPIAYDIYGNLYDRTENRGGKPRFEVGILPAPGTLD